MMIALDKKLKEFVKNQNRPIRIGLIGAGFAGRGFAMQVFDSFKGKDLILSGISNRTISEAERAYKEAGVENVRTVSNLEQLNSTISGGKYAIMDNPDFLCQSPSIDVIVEATGEVEFGARVVLEAIKNKKHIVLINAELDGTLGPILKKYADEAGVIYTQADGDQPAHIMNLCRYIEFLGFKPVLGGNIKSLIDVRRTPETQKSFAEKHFQKPKMITSFADGTKICFEMATVANATGFRVGKRGMYGPKATSVNEAASLFSKEEMLEGGLVDYILGAEPSFGVFVIGYSENPIKQRYMKVYKMGEGPFYTFYIPHHLSPIEAPLSVTRAVVFGEATLAPKRGLVTDVITVAKKDLKKGEKLDGIGGFTCYGVIENHKISAENNFLPMGLNDGCELKRDIRMDETITYGDVRLPEGRLADKLYKEQFEFFIN